jgi:formylglycine-generating enzyme required for sulfatase activity
MDTLDLLPVFLAVPSVPFLMGTPEHDLSGIAKRYGGTRESYREESPQHTLTLPPFALARTPTSNALYAAYVAATGARAPGTWRGNQPSDALAERPVVDISWHDAHDFCVWLTSAIQQPVPVHGNAAPAASVAAPQFHLPNEAEWEHAARGTDGRTFPWGETFDPACANTREAGAASTTPVGSYPAGASPYGMLDMAGNVWELTATLDALYPYEPGGTREDLQSSGRRIARGGCYANPQGFARCACRFRFEPTVRNMFMGFRLAFLLPNGTATSG